MRARKEPIPLRKKSNHKHAENCAQALKNLLADVYTLYLKTQYYHWNVKGPHFHSLHTLFNEQYEDLSDSVDLIAERIRALGVDAPGTFKEFLDLKTLGEGKSGLDAMGMVKDLVKSHEVICQTLTFSIENAKRYDDEGSLNLLADRLEKHQKMIWMLKSTVGS